MEVTEEASDVYPSQGVLLRPEWAALAMSASTVSVTVNALLLNLVRLNRPSASGQSRPGAAVPAGPYAG